MTKFLKRALALALCLCLLTPALALAEGVREGRGIRFTLEGELFPEHYPAKDQPLMKGLADLAAMLRLEGVLEYDADSMDLNVDLLLDDAEETRTRFHLYGFDALWGIGSSLLGDQQVYLNMQATLEFAAKVYFHLGIPLQRAAFFLSPYIHKDAFQALRWEWEPVLFAQQGSRVIDRDTLLTLAERLSAVAEDDRSLIYWIYAVGLESGYDGAITDALAGLADWWDSFLAEDGLTITVDGDKETWTTGEYTLFTRRVKDGWTTLSVSLPATPEGYALSGFCALREEGTTVDADLRLTITQEGGSILDWRLSADSLPTALPVSVPFDLTWNITGEAVPDGFHIRLEGEGQNGDFALRQLDAATGETMMALRGTAIAVTPVTPLDYTTADFTGVELYSLSDASLSELVRNVARPLLEGLLPLAVRAPASACQSLMDLVTDTGILDMLTSPMSSLEEDANVEYDLDEGDWDEEGTVEYEE